MQSALQGPSVAAVILRECSVVHSVKCGCRRDRRALFGSRNDGPAIRKQSGPLTGAHVSLIPGALYRDAESRAQESRLVDSEYQQANHLLRGASPTRYTHSAPVHRATRRRCRYSTTRMGLSTMLSPIQGVAGRITGSADPYPTPQTSATSGSSVSLFRRDRMVSTTRPTVTLSTTWNRPAPVREAITATAFTPAVL